ncbi:ABC transporter substrate-binding protein [Cochlodiniinecator piscidefendens]|uniref:ABC transporter substrate-binding protein n=1 Tax=Cochlodiniinecator piscidefendens TaxID=2715756 RepID=UPI0014078136|nr:glycine betaine ABC transporter substrate-binding protein [Cochlodiniinecator piscidefendens]
MKRARTFALAAATTVIGGAAVAQDVVIGVPNWASVRGTAHILKVALEDNLGLSVELQNGTNPIIFEAMDSGAMHVHPEVWMPNQQNLHDTYAEGKGSVAFNPNAVLSDQQICVTRDTQERTGISDLADLTDPDMAANFDTDGDGRGEMWIGGAGWASTNIEKIRAQSYGYAETMNLMEMDETLALAQVDNAVAQGQNIVFYCYTPHHMFSLYDLVPLNEPAYDEAQWTISQPTDDPNWLENSTAPTAWDAAKLHVVYATALAENQPEAAAMLSNVMLTTEQVNAIVYALSVDQTDPAEFARDWVDANSDLVDSWFN